MTINLSIPEPAELHPKITVIGVGGAGGNAVNNMIDADLGGVEFMVLNTPAHPQIFSLCLISWGAESVPRKNFLFPDVATLINAS